MSKVPIKYCIEKIQLETYGCHLTAAAVNVKTQDVLNPQTCHLPYILLKNQETPLCSRIRQVCALQFDGSHDTLYLLPLPINEIFMAYSMHMEQIPGPGVAGLECIQVLTYAKQVFSLQTNGIQLHYCVGR